MVNGFDMMAFGLSNVHGLILAGILLALFRLRHQMHFSNLIITLVSFFGLFLFVDDIVSGPYSGDLGLVLGGAIAIAVLQIFERYHQSRNRAAR